MDNIYLVGFMGTGKTSVGAALSGRLKKRFIETDGEIEKRERLSIPDIFKVKGEPYFRLKERELILEFSKNSDLIISCGGGLFVDERNRKLMDESGITICLWAEPDIIYNRVKNSSHRPLLNVSDPLAEIKRLLNEREASYRKARYSVDTSFLSIDEVVDEVINIVKL